MNLKYKVINQSLFICLLAFLLTNCKNTSQDQVANDGYVITGQVKGLEEGWVKMIETNFIDRKEARVIDSVQMVGGKFDFKGKAAQEDMVNLWIDNKYNCRFILENQPIDIAINVAEAEERSFRVKPSISGSTYNTIFLEQSAKEMTIFYDEKYATLNELREEMRTAYQSKEEALIAKVKEKQQALKPLTDQRNKEYRNAKFEFVKSNPSSIIAPYVLGFQFGEGRMSKEEMETFYHLFKGDARETAMFKHYEKTYNEVFNSLGEGSTVPDFTLTTLEGETLTLSEVEGKYIFIDFWASWCVPCRNSFPHLKEKYAKYKKDGFNVVAVGTSDIGSKWEKAIKEDKTVWNHVFDGDRSIVGRKGDYGEVAKAYSVPFLPTTFLVDDKGVIIGRQLRGKELDAKLEELFGY